ncbi:MAG: LamG domain-containing protein [Akkermansia sp.]|nr:LamG domain-containing protein [Akkermansia sp.]
MTDGLVAWWTFDEDGSYTSYTGFAGGVNTGLNEKNMNLTGGVDGKGYISSHYDGGNMDFYDGMGSMNISASSFTLSFKVNGATADYRSLFSMNIGEFGQVNMQTENPNNGSDTCLYATNNSIEITSDAARTSIRGENGWANVILTGDGQTLTLYVNGDSASVTYAPGADSKLSNFQLGSQWGDGSRRVQANFDDLAIWNRTLGADEIALLSQGAIANGTLPVPEPTTATLSLLALAGLAARRRRK